MIYVYLWLVVMFGNKDVLSLEIMPNFDVTGICSVVGDVLTARVAVAVLGGVPSSTAHTNTLWVSAASRSSPATRRTVPVSSTSNWWSRSLLGATWYWTRLSPPWGRDSDRLAWTPYFNEMPGGPAGIFLFITGSYLCDYVLQILTYLKMLEQGLCTQITHF